PLRRVHYNPAAPALALAPALPHAAAGEGGGFYDPARVTQISWRPRAFLYSGFLSHAECDHLIKLVSCRSPDGFLLSAA
uniref:Uncharacterized protein n=1 Tax=Triticum urartu TaxID=4572 RepID=A0A8R7QJQ1_TRIUA